MEIPRPEPQSVEDAENGIETRYPADRLSNCHDTAEKRGLNSPEDIVREQHRGTNDRQVRRSPVNEPRQYLSKDELDGDALKALAHYEQFVRRQNPELDEDTLSVLAREPVWNKTLLSMIKLQDRIDGEMRRTHPDLPWKSWYELDA